MIHYIGTSEGQLINLAACVLIDDVTDEIGPTTVEITTTLGEVLTLEGDDAVNLIEAVQLLSLETANARQALARAVNQIQQTEVPQ